MERPGEELQAAKTTGQMNMKWYIMAKPTDQMNMNGTLWQTKVECKLQPQSFKQFLLKMLVSDEGELFDSIRRNLAHNFVLFLL